MPSITVELEGKFYSVQDDQSRTIRTLKEVDTPGLPDQIETAYRFYPHSTEVRVISWRLPSPLWAREEEDQGMNVPERQLLSDTTHHLRDFLVEGGYESYKNDGDFRYLSQLEEEQMKPKGKPMPCLKTGTRVRTAHSTRIISGTVVKQGASHRNVLLCLDEPDPRFNADQKSCGVNHGLWVDIHGIQVLEPLSQDPQAKWGGIPRHIGMFAHRPFRYTGRKFQVGSVGRVAAMKRGLVTLNWFNVPGLGPDTHFSVPVRQLSWCRFDPSSFRIEDIWHSQEQTPTTQTPTTFEAGEILTYWSDKPCTLSGNDGLAYAVTKGVLLRYEGAGESDRSVQVVVASGMVPELIGAAIHLRKQDVRKFEGTFVPSGKDVEIVAQVMFRKKNLQGRRGKVILATDFEGDVGIQFPENLDAGSLDGAGKEGQCLYVPAESVKEISE